MSEFNSSCPKCGKPIRTVNGKVPKHTIGVDRGTIIQVTCPGSGQRPN